MMLFHTDDMCNAIDLPQCPSSSVFQSNMTGKLPREAEVAGVSEASSGIEIQQNRFVY